MIKIQLLKKIIIIEPEIDAKVLVDVLNTSFSVIFLKKISNKLVIKNCIFNLGKAIAFKQYYNIILYSGIICLLNKTNSFNEV